MISNILATISVPVSAVSVVGGLALAKPADGKQAQAQVVAIEVTRAGFVPAQIKTKANQPMCGS